MHVTNHQYGGIQQNADRIDNTFGAGTTDPAAGLHTLIGALAEARTAGDLDPATAAEALRHTGEALTAVQDPGRSAGDAAASLRRVQRILAGIRSAAPLAGAAAGILAAILGSGGGAQ
jgi:hypothetical protein